MSFLHRDESSATRVTNFSARNELGLDGRAIIGRVDHPSLQCYRPVHRSRSEKLHMKFCRHGAGGFAFAAFSHQMIRSRPIGVTVEQSSDDPTVENSGERLMMRLGHELSDDFIAFDKTSNVQTLLIFRPASEADPVR